MGGRSIKPIWTADASLCHLMRPLSFAGVLPAACWSPPCLLGGRRLSPMDEVRPVQIWRSPVGAFNLFVETFRWEGGELVV